MLPKDIHTLEEVKSLLQKTQAKSKTKHAVSLAETSKLANIINKKLNTLKIPKTKSKIGAT
jgi:hypothetical protein